MRIVAFDLSLTATGFATDDESGVLVPPKGADRGMARLRWIRREVLELAAGADLVVLEGYAFAAKGNAIVSLAELGGVVRIALADSGLMYVDVPPASLKLFATGKGNAPKDEVLAAAIRKLGYEGHDHNEADALWLHEMAATRYAAIPLHKPNADQLRALDKIAWPNPTPLTPTTAP